MKLPKIKLPFLGKLGRGESGGADSKDGFGDRRKEGDQEESNSLLAKVAGPLRGLAAKTFPAVATFVGTGNRRRVVLGAAGVGGLFLVVGVGLLIFAAASDKTTNGDSRRATLEIESREASSSVFGGAESGTVTSPQDGLARSNGQPLQPPNAIGAQEGLGAAAGVIVPSTSHTAFDHLPSLEKGERMLALAPDPELVEQVEGGGMLPRIGADGRQVWKVYAKSPPPPSARPRIAIIIRGLGLSRTATEAAIRRLPGNISLAFNPYSHNLRLQISMARQAGHEVLLGLPLGTADFLRVDPGPYALRVGQKRLENLKKLNFLLGQAAGYVGMLSTHGNGFTSQDSLIRPVLKSLKSRGLMFVDGGDSEDSLAPAISAEIGLPQAVNRVFLDKNPSRLAIDDMLEKLEQIARKEAFAVAVGNPYPITLQRLSAWIGTLERKQLDLAPITALADKQTTW